MEFSKGLVEGMVKAISEGNLEKVKELSGSIASTSSVNCLRLKKSGDTLLHVAARTSNASEILRYLIEEGHGNIELGNCDGKTPLHDAAQFNQFDSVQLLLEHGANINALKRADWTPLMLACTKQDSLQVIKLLLSYAPDLCFTNKDGWNCFHIACREGNLEIVEYLISYTANTYKDSSHHKTKLLFSKSKNGRNSLHTSVMHGHFEICQLLLKESKRAGEEEERNFIQGVDKCGSSPPMDACRFGHLKILDLLWENSVVDEDHNYPSSISLNGMNCLHIAAEAGQCDVMKHLVLKYNFEVNSAGQKYGLTPLHYAVRENQVGAINTLLELGASAQLCDYKGWTSMDMCKHLKKKQALEALQNFSPMNH